MSQILDIKEEKIITTELSVKVNEDFVKELAILLLKGDFSLITFVNDIDGFISKQSAEIMLSNGVRLTVIKES